MSCTPQHSMHDAHLGVGCMGRQAICRALLCSLQTGSLKLSRGASRPPRKQQLHA